MSHHKPLNIYPHKERANFLCGDFNIVSMSKEVWYYGNMKNISFFCWNIGNPSLERAARQGKWLRERPEDVFILSETKKSRGCAFLENYFRTHGYFVVSSMPKEKEYGVMIVSRYPLAKSVFSDYVSFLRARVAAVHMLFSQGALEIIGLYVPSRDASPEKIKRKKYFLENIINALEAAPKSNFRIFCGDFNILEPSHIPKYSFFQEWENAFYKNLERHKLRDVFRYVSPFLQEYSWVGRTGDGYRYDHFFTSENMLSGIRKCFYSHEPRNLRLSDHSAIIAELRLTDNNRISL